MHIYAFGSICRGEIEIDSDVDLLAIEDKKSNNFDIETFSIYSYKKINELWNEGNPFAWHLATESRLIYSSDNRDYLKGLKQPNEYKNCKKDSYKFYDLFCAAFDAINKDSFSVVFELSTIFLSIRNFATCYSLGKHNDFNFSRHSAIKMREKSLNISMKTFNLLERSRILSVRGYGKNILIQEAHASFKELRLIKTWMESLLLEV